jgi:tetrahydromethanopterin S-methyltransferase subunit G
MADENPTQVLDYLREQFARLHSRLDRIEHTLQEHGQRISLLEQQMAQLSSSEQGHYAAVMQRLDHLGERIDRIERRLDLVVN